MLQALFEEIFQIRVNIENERIDLLELGAKPEEVVYLLVCVNKKWGVNLENFLGEFPITYKYWRIMSMRRIIIIDDPITDLTLINRNVNTMYEINDDFTVSKIDMKKYIYISYDTHADMCAKVICKYIKSVEFINIVIKEPNANGHIKKLIRALDFAYKIEADVIHMSVGTNSILYAREMHKCIKELAKKMLIVAAKANNNKRTFPADFREVCCCRAGEQKEIQALKNKTFAVYPVHMIRGKNKEVLFTPATNSFAAAYFTAMYCSENWNNKTLHKNNNYTEGKK